MFTALIPVKALHAAKQRLSAVLQPLERREFAAAMLVDTLEMVSQVASVGRIVVVTRDPDAAAIAIEYSADVFEECGMGGLNAALDGAVRELRAADVFSTIVLPTDIVLAEAKDLIELIEEHQRSESDVTIAAARVDFGTNCLLINARCEIPFCFGPLSSLRHSDAAISRGYKTRIVRCRNVENDIDAICDLQMLFKLAPQRHSCRYLLRSRGFEQIVDGVRTNCELTSD